VALNLSRVGATGPNT